MVCKMADAKKFPVLLGFYTRELRDKTFGWFRQEFHGKKALKLDSPLERLEHLYGFDTKEFLNDFLEPNAFFSKALRAYLEWTHPGKDAKVNRIVGSYQQASAKFRKDLKRFYAGEFDVVLGKIVSIVKNSWMLSAPPVVSLT